MSTAEPTVVTEACSRALGGRSPVLAPLFCRLLGVIKMQTVEMNAFPPDMLFLLKIEFIFSTRT